MLSQYSVGQCCNSKKLENPRRTTEKTPENPRSRFCGKIELFLEKIEVFSKKAAFIEKISDDLFFTFNGPKTEKTTTRSILSHQKPLAFQQKTLQNMYFSGKSDKTPEKL